MQLKNIFFSDDLPKISYIVCEKLRSKSLMCMINSFGLRTLPWGIAVMEKAWIRFHPINFGHLTEIAKD